MQEDNIEIRKLVKTGADTYTISLPKSWIVRNNLEKGVPLYLKIFDNKIEITPEKEKTKRILKEKTINIDEKDINAIRRDTISAYINNYNTIMFYGKTLNEKFNDIRKVLSNFLAMEIIEQTETKIVVKDFLNIKEFSPINTVRRMDMLTRTMMDDIKQGIKDLEAKDFEVDKLFFLISRLTRAALMNEINFELTNAEIMNLWWFAKNLERIADSLKELAPYYDDKELKNIFDELQEYYRECIKSFFKKDKELADKLIEKRFELYKKLEKVKQGALLKDIIRNSRNIAKIILDAE